MYKINFTHSVTKFWTKITMIKLISYSVKIVDQNNANKINFILSLKTNCCTQLFNYYKFWSNLTCLSLMRCFFFNEMIENRNCQGSRIRQPIDKKHRQTEVLYYVFWSILSQMRHACWFFFSKNFVPKFACSMIWFDLILFSYLHKYI